MSYPFRNYYHRTRKKLFGAVDRLWPSLPLAEQVDVLYEERRTYDFGLPSPVPSQARKFLEDWQQKPDLEAVYRVKGHCSIDPKMGIAFSGGKVIWGSSDLPERERGPRFLSHLMKPDRSLDRAISLHHLHGDNYCHLFLFVLSRVLACKKAGLPSTIPFIVGETTANTLFFEQAKQLGLFGEHEVIIQPRKEIFRVGECYLTRGFAVHAPNFDLICSQLGLEVTPLDGAPLLLTRDSSAANGRVYRNQTALNEMLEQRGFQVIDPGKLPVIEQAKLFNGTPLIVSPHGAGLTNLIFRRKTPFHLIELFNPGMGSGHYYQIARERGFGYTSQMTINPIGKRSFTASTEVDLDALSSVLDSLRAEFKSS